MHKKFWLWNVKVGDGLENIGADGRIILKWDSM
jgi:hypothetical protein